MASLLVFSALLINAGSGSAQVLLETTDDPRIRECLNQHMLHVPGTEREWTAHLTLGGDGQVTAATLEPIVEGELGECLRQALIAMRFADHAAHGLTTLEYPVVYRVTAAADIDETQDTSLTARIVVVMSQNHEALDGCFASINPSQPDDLRISPQLTVDTEGQVRKVTFLTEPSGYGVEPCVAEAFRQITFPLDPTGRPYQFAYPIRQTIWGSAHPGARRRRRADLDPPDFEIDYDFEFDFEHDFDIEFDFD